MACIERELKYSNIFLRNYVKGCVERVTNYGEVNNTEFVYDTQKRWLVKKYKERRDRKQIFF